MDNKLHQINLNSTNSFLGKILIATPYMSNKIFEKTVVYIHAQTHSQLSGIIINKTLDGLTFKDLLQQVNIPHTPTMQDQNLAYGGPMDIRHGTVLHTLDYKIACTDVINDYAGITTTLDILKAMANNKGPLETLVVLGYCTWEKESIEKSLLNNEWIITTSSEHLLFQTTMEEKWMTAFQTMGIKPHYLTSTVGHG